ncbi:rhamnogalacturonan lyase B N-terminal domain-containing protein [Actinoplanes lobatus]|nr:rhamnogalacturonan lyase B N-terminal domain-containing protein [Actinoplanes lobatus]MBB4750610.1 rhamnogalacturonan endolyase [Actinoplanes lobatus]
MTSPQPQPRLNRRSLIKATGVGGLVIGAGALATVALPASAAAFGWSDDGSNYVVDTGADLVFKVSKSNGDLNSFVHRGVEYQGYGKNSHVESGLGASTVTISASGSTILITVVHGSLIHYYAARSGENNIYMWTYKAADSVTMQRYIVRLKPGLLTFTGGDAWDSAATTTIEAGDVFRATDGTTHSKHYSGLRVMDYDYIGAKNAAGTVGIWMVRSNHEKASGGPFFRSLLRSGSTGSPDLYEIVWYNMAQTEAQRYGLHGPYILSFTDGGAPSSALYARNLTTSWADGLGIRSHVPASGRGRVAGVGINGRDAAYTYTVGFANTDAQYWAVVNAGTGYFSCPGMLPGTYTMTVYKDELAVQTGSVTVTAGGTTTLNTITITGDPSTAPAVWRIGDWTGSPKGFKNADLMTYAHPSDPRAAAWTGNFIVGTSAVSAFPCYQWVAVNNDLLVYFKLTAAQAAAAHTLRIGLSASYAGGRHRVSVNGWTSAIPAAPGNSGTRSLTVGAYRSYTSTLTYAVPASAFQTDTAQWNVLKLSVVSGSSGDGYLSPGLAFDCIDLLA